WRTIYSRSSHRRAPGSWRHNDQNRRQRVIPRADCDGRGGSKCPNRYHVYSGSGGMGLGIPNKEGPKMGCRVCGGLLERRVTDLPFKIGDSSIVILKALPVLQCRQCGDTEVEHETMLRVEQVLGGVDTSSELKSSGSQPE